MTTEQRELPTGWKWVKLGDVCAVVTGNTPSKSNSSYYGGEWTWVNPSHLDQSQYIYESSEYLTDAGAKQARVVPTGAVLISCIGYIGKAAIAGKSLCTNQQINSLVPTPVVDSEFLYWCMNRVRTRLERSASGVTVKLINKTNFSKFEIPLPPLEEQKRIAEILNKADEIKKLREEADKKTEELIPAIFHEMFGRRIKKGGDLPSDWKWVKLGDVCLLIVDSEHKTAPIASQGYPYVRTPDIGKGFLHLRDARRVSRDTYVNWTKKAIPHAGDLILTREAPVGNVAVVPANTELCLGQRTVLLRADPKLAVAQYLCYLLLGDSVQQTFHSLASGATLPHLNLGDIRKLEILLPPLEEQQRIAERLNGAEEIKKTNAESDKKIEELKSSLLQRAFRGEL